MSLFVDHAGLNTLISEEITSSINTRGVPIVRNSSPAPRDSSIVVSDTSENRANLEASGLTGYPTTGALTFSFWVKLDNIADNTVVRYVMYAKNASSYAQIIYFQSGQIKFAAKSASSFKTWSFNIPLQDFINTWKHVHIIWNGNFSSNPTIAINAQALTGPESTNGSATGTTYLAPDGFVFFDHNIDDPRYELAGSMQFFHIYKTTISSLELYNNGTPKFFNSVAHLVDFWRFGNEPQFSNISHGSTISNTIILSTSGTIGTNLTSSASGVKLGNGFTSTEPVVVTNSGYYIGFVGSVSGANKLAALNTHRNGPYGYSTWKQLRVSENPITRHHKENSTMTFVVQPGPVRNVLPNGELRVRDRYSSLYTFTEPAIAQKAFPLVWNVGRHFKDENGNVDLENPERFSIISSYANQGIGFANNQVDKFHKFDPDEEKTEYREIFKLYAEGGLNDLKSPITHWEFLQYKETIFPHMKNQFQTENLERPTFESFFRHNRADRTITVATSSLGYEPKGGLIKVLSQSTWPLDEREKFLTRTYIEDSSSVEFNQNGEGAYPFKASFQRNGEGNLMQTISQFNHFLAGFSGPEELNDPDPGVARASVLDIDARMGPGALYMRRTSLFSTASVSNPSGMEIPQTGSLSQNKLFQGGALWEAGPTREVKDGDGNYISAPKKPFYDTYEDYIEEARRRYKNFSVIPEFRMSTQVEDYLTNDKAIELDMFEVTGGVENAQNSSKSQFYEIYSNSDFMRQFELINEDHKEFTNGKVLSLRCKAVKKFLPYEGFYPAQRTVDLAKRFYDSFKNNISLFNGNGLELNNFNYGRQMVMTPLFAPGVLFNTIKSGIAVDYPIITNNLSTTPSLLSNEFLISENFNKRIPFEALVEPHRHLAGFSLTSNEPHPSGNLSASAKWDGQGDELYSKMANNFLAEVPEFFLPNGQFTSVVSKKQKDIALVSGSVYGMRVKIRRTMNGARGSVYHSGSLEQSYYPPQDVNSNSEIVRENFTMYSRPSAFGPPTDGVTSITDPGQPSDTIDIDESSHNFFSFDIVSRFSSSVLTTAPSKTYRYFTNSTHGINYPFTPPYYHGEGWCEIVLTASSDTMTIAEIQSIADYTYTRYDNSFFKIVSDDGEHKIAEFQGGGPQSLLNINSNAVQLSSSLNLQGIGKVGKDGGGLGGAGGNLVVDTAVDEDSRWVIQTKFETPMFNFNHISAESGNLSIPVYGSESVPRGIWHQYGRIPEENEGVFLEVGPIEENYLRKARGYNGGLKDLSAALGFSGQSTKIGRLRSSKTIYEAVVAVPFIQEEGRKKFFSLDPHMVAKYKAGGENLASLTTGDPQEQIGRSVLNQLQKMEKYIFPPSFDFLNNDIDDVKPVAMYIFEFSHTLNQQDLADIWQNLPPDIGTEMEESEVAITHPLLKKELLGEGGETGNILIDMPNKLRWMVFKVKQRAASNYFKKTVLRNPDVNTETESANVTVDEFGNTSHIQFNWPYDFFSLVELVKIDAEVEFGVFDENDIANYTNSIPPYVNQTADMEKIEFIVGGIEDDILADEPIITGGEEFGDIIDPEPEPEPSGPEGIFDVPDSIPDEDSRTYVLLKGRFTVEANKDPLTPVPSLTARAAGELLAIGVQTLNIASITEQAFLSWAQNWYDTDSNFQLKKEEARDQQESTQRLNEQIQANNRARALSTARSFTLKRFFIELDKARVRRYSKANKRKSAERAIEAATTKFKKDPFDRFYDSDFENSIKSYANTLANASKQTLNAVYRPGN